MKMVKKILIAAAPLRRCAAAPLLTLAAAPGTANATGYIRIGDKCYLDMGVLIPFPCPNEVGENP